MTCTDVHDFEADILEIISCECLEVNFIILQCRNCGFVVNQVDVNTFDISVPLPNGEVLKFSQPEPILKDDVKIISHTSTDGSHDAAILADGERAAFDEIMKFNFGLI